MVIGSGAIGKFWRHRLEEEFSRFQGRLTFVWSDDLSLQEILRRCSTLPENSAIFFLTLGTDATGVAYADERVLADLHATANAPLFSAHDVYLGSGIVGGRLMPIEAITRRMTDSAYRILNGASPSDVKVPPQVPGQPKFDWRELQRWGIPESRLPPGSLVQFRGPTLWSQYSGTVLIVAARIGDPGAVDHRVIVRAPRTAQGRSREPQEPGARRGYQSPRDDVGADQHDCA